MGAGIAPWLEAQMISAGAMEKARLRPRYNKSDRAPQLAMGLTYRSSQDQWSIQLRLVDFARPGGEPCALPRLSILFHPWPSMPLRAPRAHFQMSAAAEAVP